MARKPVSSKKAKKSPSRPPSKKGTKDYSAEEFEGAQQLYEQSGDVEAVKKHAKQSADSRGVASAADDVAKSPKGKRTSRRSAKRTTPGSRG